MKPMTAVITRWLDEEADPWQSCRTTDGAFRTTVAPYYFGDEGHCMLVTAVTGTSFESKYMVGGHIWPRHKPSGLKKFGLNPAQIDSPRNGLVLLKSVEEAFDQKRFCFVYNMNGFAVKVLDPQLSDEDVALKNIHNRKIEGVVQYLGRNLVYKDLDTKNLDLPAPVDGVQAVPFRRLLSEHATQALAAAVRSGWIAQAESDEFVGYNDLSGAVSRASGYALSVSHRDDLESDVDKLDAPEVREIEGTCDVCDCEPAIILCHHCAETQYCAECAAKECSHV